MSRKLTTQEFIEKTRKVHNEKYDYSLVKYNGAHQKVKIICPEHGIFEQSPNNHLSGCGCPKCAIEKRKSSLEEFINKVKHIHDNKYDYSLVEYKNNATKVKIICPEHGIFEQSPNNHLSGRGCAKCREKEKLTTQKFIEKAKLVHGDKYNYSLFEYKNSSTKIIIICPKHGVFKQVPSDHLRGRGCPKCGRSKKLTTQEFIEKARGVHDNKYDYSLVEYKNNATKVKIVCPEHGIFEQRPSNHLRGNGCPKCAIEKRKSSLEEFIQKAISIHRGRYDYSLVEYKHSKQKVKIICPDHGIFEQIPSDHLKGHSCPKCPTKISKPEQELADFISSLGHDIIQTYRGWCPERPQLEIDIYIPELNIGFEFNGSYWHSLKSKNYHKEKTILALNNNIKLIHIWEDKWKNNPEQVKTCPGWVIL